MNLASPRILYNTKSHLQETVKSIPTGKLLLTREVLIFLSVSPVGVNLVKVNPVGVNPVEVSPVGVNPVAVSYN